MRAYLPDYEAISAHSLAEALDLLGSGEVRPLAGGTDLMVLLAAGGLPPGRYLDLWPCRELHGIAVTPSHVALGALCTYSEIRRHPVVQAELPCLVQAA